jgi:small neutral amino acid transporter SnatA (MarC family)
VFALALTFFLVANPIGNSPAIIALVKDFDFNRQRVIMLREGLLALLLALFFQYAGEIFLGGLHISDYAVTFTGGVILFLVSLSMIFSQHFSDADDKVKKPEPFFVPIATPILSGAGLLSVIMINAKIEQNNLKLTMAILLAWVGVFGVLLAAPYLQKLIGKRGLAAMEQIMGMILAMISIEMIVKGSALFVAAVKN